MKTTHITLLLAAAALSGAPLHAGLVTWAAPTGISGASDVSTTGTLIGAVNFNGPATTVNGVNFQALATTGPSNTVGNFDLSAPFFYPSQNTSDSAAPFASLSAGYQFLLGSAAATGGTMTLTMSGLNIGQSYEFEAWVNDSRNQTPPGFTFKVDGTAGNTVTLDPNPSLAAGGLGQFVIGTFVADASSQQVEFSNSEAAVVNGFQLRQVTSPIIPEPGTALFGMALLGAAGLTRRRSASRVNF